MFWALGARESKTMSRSDTYPNSIPKIRLAHSKPGVPTVALHTTGRVLAFNAFVHERFVDAFHTVSSDRDNRLVGTAGTFRKAISAEGFDLFAPQNYEEIHHEGETISPNILDVGVPLTVAVNGSVHLQSECVLPAGIVPGTASAEFGERPNKTPCDNLIVRGAQHAPTMDAWFKRGVDADTRFVGLQRRKFF
jgi:hypothetical protein